MAFFRVKLGAQQVIAPNEGGDRPAIINCRQPVIRIFQGEMIAMDEIGMGTRPDPFKYRMNALRKIQIIPAHMGNF